MAGRAVAHMCSHVFCNSLSLLLLAQLLNVCLVIYLAPEGTICGKYIGRADGDMPVVHDAGGRR